MRGSVREDTRPPVRDTRCGTSVAVAAAPLDEVLNDLLAADEAGDGQRLRDISYGLVTRVSAEAHAARLEATLGQRIAGLVTS